MTIQKFKLYSYFFRQFLPISILTNLEILHQIKEFGLLKVSTILLFEKIVIYAACLWFFSAFRKNTLPFYYNLGIAPRHLGLSAIVFDLLICGIITASFNFIAHLI